MENFDKIITRKIYLLFGACLCLSMGMSLVAAKVSNQQFQPRMRVSRSASLTVTTTFQKVDFSGSNTLNVNTFQTDLTSGNPMVYWDATNKIFKFYNTVDMNYLLYFQGACSATLLTTPVSLRYRITIPNGVSPGVDLHFPNTDNSGGGDGYSDLGPVTYIAHRPFDQSLPVYISQVIRTNGFYLEVALSNGTLGTVTLDYTALVIQATNSIN